jgi:hypothetical protein
MAVVYMQASLGGVFFMQATDLAPVATSLLKRFQLLYGYSIPLGPERGLIVLALNSLSVLPLSREPAFC